MCNSLKLWRTKQLTITTSTNDDAKRAAEAGEAEGLVIWALRQTAGRGRQGRTWESPEGNLYCSVLLRPQSAAKDVGLYSFVAALAMYDVVVECLGCSESGGVLPPLGGELEGGYNKADPSPAKTKGLAKAKPKFSLPLPQGERNITLKWPNDVLVEGHKIGGILIEVAGDALVIGMGLNVMHHPEEALYPATSLFHEGYVRKERSDSPPLAGGVGGGGHRQSKSLGLRSAPPPNLPLKGGGTLPVSPHENPQPPLDEILDMLLQNLEHWYGIMKTEGFEPIRAAWLKHAQKGPMHVRLPQGEIRGEFTGLDEQGRLQLRLADGSERAIATGEVGTSG